MKNVHVCILCNLDHWVETVLSHSRVISVSSFAEFNYHSYTTQPLSSIWIPFPARLELYDFSFCEFFSSTVYSVFKHHRRTFSFDLNIYGSHIYLLIYLFIYLDAYFISLRQHVYINEDITCLFQNYHQVRSHVRRWIS